MADSDLAGIGVLVTRPRHQAAGLTEAIEQRGGSALGFPVIDIVPRAPNEIADDANALHQPDITVFISSNAVRTGLDHAGSGRLAVVGPATAAALESAGHRVDISSVLSFDSEHLLDAPELNDVERKVVRIIRGTGGRELIADTLKDRGAIVEYLPVYSRVAPQYSESELKQLESQWRAGDIDIVTVMSVESFNNLVQLLPVWCKTQLQNTPLVTPAARVIKEAIKQFPSIPATLARGPLASDMVDAILMCR